MTQIVAHRANDAGMLEAALAAGCRRVEVDASVHEGRLVCAHDPGSDGADLNGILALAAAAGLAVTVDLKCPAAAVPAVCAAITDTGLGERVLLSGHYDRPWAELRALLPGALLGWSTPEPGRWERVLRRGALQRDLAASAPARLQAKGLDVLLAHHALVSEPLVHALHGDGHHLHAWTVNRAGQARRLARLGVDAIVTDRPREVAAGLAGA